MPSPMTTEEALREALALLEKATPGPWRWSMNGNIVPAEYAQDCEIAAVYSEHMDDIAVPANAAAIIAAINFLRDHGAHLASLAADAGPCRAHECRRVRAEMQAEIDRLRAEVGELHMHAQRRDQYAVEKAAQALDWKKRAERLAEALRKLSADLRTLAGGETPDGDGVPVNVTLWAEKRIATIDAARRNDEDAE